MISRRNALRAALLALLAALSAALALVGKAHTVILANEATALDGATLPAPDAVSVRVDGERAEELGRAERAQLNVAGPGHRVAIEVLSGAGAGRKVERRFSVPFGWDTVLLSIPAALAGAPPDIFAARYRAPPQEEAPVERTVQQADSDIVPLPPAPPPPAARP